MNLKKNIEKYPWHLSNRRWPQWKKGNEQMLEELGSRGSEFLPQGPGEVVGVFHVGCENTEQPRNEQTVYKPWAWKVLLTFFVKASYPPLGRLTHRTCESFRLGNSIFKVPS